MYVIEVGGCWVVIRRRSGSVEFEVGDDPGQSDRLRPSARLTCGASQPTQRPPPPPQRQAAQPSAYGPLLQRQKNVRYGREMLRGERDRLNQSINRPRPIESIKCDAGMRPHRARIYASSVVPRAWCTALHVSIHYHARASRRATRPRPSLNSLARLSSSASAWEGRPEGPKASTLTPFAVAASTPSQCSHCCSSKASPTAD